MGSLRSIRIYSPFFPFPPVDGSLHVIAEQVRTLTALGLEVELVCWKRTGAEPEPQLAHGARVRWIPLGADAREGVLTRGARVAGSLARGQASPEAYYYPARRPRGLPPMDLGIYNYSFAYAWLSQRSWLGRRGGGAERSTAVYFHNLESELFEQRAQADSQVLRQAVHRLNYGRLAHHERLLGGLADQLWFLSASDEERYREKTACAKTRVVPPTFTAELTERRRLAFEARVAQLKQGPPVLGFLGNLEFGPNIDSLSWVLAEVAPGLKAALGPQLKLRVGGRMGDSQPGKELRAQLMHFPFARVEGFLEDTEEFWSSLSYFLAPDVSGSGVRMKIIEALASGVPTLTTPGGAARLCRELRSHPLLHVAAEPEHWLRELKREAPFALRARLQDEARHWSRSRALDGRALYSELLGL